MKIKHVDKTKVTQTEPKRKPHKKSRTGRTVASVVIVAVLAASATVGMRLGDDSMPLSDVIPNIISVVSGNAIQLEKPSDTNTQNGNVSTPQNGSNKGNDSSNGSGTMYSTLTDHKQSADNAPSLKSADASVMKSTSWNGMVASVGGKEIALNSTTVASIMKDTDWVPSGNTVIEPHGDLSLAMTSASHPNVTMTLRVYNNSDSKIDATSAMFDDIKIATSDASDTGDVTLAGNIRLGMSISEARAMFPSNETINDVDGFHAIVGDDNGKQARLYWYNDDDKITEIDYQDHQGRK